MPSVPTPESFQKPINDEKAINVEKSEKNKLSRNSKNSLLYKGNKSIAERVNDVVQNSDGKFPCPDCDKPFGSRGALPKHLLSHLPQKEWPFVCLYCGKHMQAKNDLPKHWKTSVHAKHSIPEPGTSEYNELMANSLVIEWPPKL